MTQNKFESYEYTVNGLGGFTLTEALRLWKTKYAEDFRDFEKDVITAESLHEFRDFVKEVWDDIQEITVEEALKHENTEIRRTYFDAIGIQKLFAQLEPVLLDRQVIKKKRTRWDNNNDPYEYEFEDIYELYTIPGSKLFGKTRWGGEPNPVYAVRCWCTTTNREYWLYVPQDAATGKTWSSDKEDYDAIRAIAWTIRIDVKKPERIYRQGDIIVVKKGAESEETRNYHLNKEQYLSLMYSES
jgi:hypothetical protein